MILIYTSGIFIFSGLKSQYLNLILIHKKDKEEYYFLEQT